MSRLGLEIGRSIGGRVSLRRYPYPYVAAFALSNDIDSTFAPRSLEWQSYVNGTAETPYGDGLGLEIAESFWLWSPQGFMALWHSKPGREIQLSQEAPLICELARRGWYDTLHSAGSFLSDTPLVRANVEKAVELLLGEGVSVPVFTNHSGQTLNVGHRWSDAWHGDDLDHPAYSLDLMKDLGCQFYWHDYFYDLDNFGAQGITLEAKAPKIFKRLNIDRAEIRGVDPDVNFANRTLHYLKAGGMPLIFFKRFRGAEAPQSGNFGSQVADHRLDALERDGRVVIVYQHMGVWRSPGRDKKHPSRTHRRQPVLDDSAVWTFKELAQRSADGRLFVTTTSRLLKYLWVNENITARVETNSETWWIILDEISCPSYGPTPIDRSHLDGIAFCVPPTAPEVRVRTSDGVEITGFIRVKADRTDIVYRPWPRLVWPSPAELKDLI